VTGLSGLGLSSQVTRILEANGITDPERLTALNERELRGFAGIGAKKLTEIVAALDVAGLSLAEDAFAPYVCVREGRAAWDVNLADLFLCDQCADDWQGVAFSGAEAEYVGASVSGYCVSCNQLRDVRLRQWKLCGNCERVARSIGRGVAAEYYLGETWRQLGISRRFDLRQTDNPTLRAYRRDRAKEKVAAIDFVVRDRQAKEDVFGFELKTGKGHLGSAGHPGNKMSEFQLDTTDCDDITTVMGNRRFPVYLVHVQVIDRAHAPTALYVPLGAWWTDPFRMSDGFKRVQQRSRETRDAAYFEPSIFDEFRTFADYLRGGGNEQLAGRLQQEGIPALYRR
jgi:hypothetical protein